MGLMDRDYMKDSSRDRPFRPPPESALAGWLGKLVILVCILYLGFKLADWLDHRAKPAPAKALITAVPVVQTTVQPTTQLPTTAPSLPKTPLHLPMRNVPAESDSIIKCVINGKTSYGDNTCAAGAMTSKVVIKQNQNLIAPITVPSVAQAITPAPAPITITRVNPGPDYAALKAECAWLDASIKHLDDLARQPQSGSMQDWIRDERKKMRDRQFRIRCQ